MLSIPIKERLCLNVSFMLSTARGKSPFGYHKMDKTYNMLPVRLKKTVDADLL
jgi:hypothetical protein